MPIKNRIAEMHDEIAAWRRDFHEHPELLYDTRRTAEIVAAKLREFGCDEVAEGIGRTGVVGLIRGRSDTSGRVVGIRADMDALPITGGDRPPYASKTPGLMHACGHDGHTAMLLGAAKYLAETRNFDGAAAVIFQPAEEGGAGGKAMVDDGLIDRFRIREVYGMHNSPSLPLGAFAIRPGPFYAATNSFTIAVIGRGGHAARPHATVDPTLIASHLVLALQSIVSRNADPDAFDRRLGHQLPHRDRRLQRHPRDGRAARHRAHFRSRAARAGGDAGQGDRGSYGRSLSAAAPRSSGSRAIPRWSITRPRPVSPSRRRAASRRPSILTRRAVMGGEDFAYMLEACPGAYIQIGAGEGADLHHPAYDFNDEIIPAGASYWAELVESRLPVG